MNKKILHLLIQGLLFLSLVTLSTAEENDEKNQSKSKAAPPKETWGIKGNFKSWGIISAVQSPNIKSQDPDFIIFPLVDHPFFKYRGFQKDFYVHPMVAITPSLTYSGNNSFNNYDLNGKYRNLRSRYGTVEGGVSSSVRLGPFSAVLGMRSDVWDTYNGNRYYLQFNGIKKFEPLPVMRYSITLNHFTNNYMNYYFGISESESQKTGLASYNPDSCSSIAANISFIHPLKENVVLILTGGIERLGKEAESDFLETRNISSLAAIVSWTPN